MSVPTATAARKGLKSKPKGPATSPKAPLAPAAPVDFKALAAETRAKLKASSDVDRGVNAEPDATLPPIGSTVLVSPHDEEGPVGAPFQATVQEHLTPQQQQESGIEGAALVVERLAIGKGTDHVRLDEVALLDSDTSILPVPVDTAEMVSNAPLPALPLWPGILGLHEVPLSQTTRSSCNVRSHYDVAAIEELAASLAAQGQQQNATGRWNAEGQIEIVAGESRRRAQLLRVERGEISADYPFTVRIREMSDAEALEISATENMRRRSMTALEECEAMARMQDAGRTVEALAALFGYKSLQPVADRILVARNLLTGPREALDEGKISLAQAFVIARAPGKNLQNQMVDEGRYHSAAKLAQILTQGQFLVKTAAFNVEKSGLKVMTDLFDTFEPYFENKAKALEAQIAHANVVAERRRAKGDRAFVSVETGESTYFSLYSSRTYESASQSAPDAGTVLYVCTSTGALLEEKGVRLQKKAGVKVSESGEIEKVQVERKMPDSAFLEAHRYRATAAREAVLGNTHLTLALTVWGLVLGSNSDLARIKVDPCSSGLQTPELDARAAALADLFRDSKTGNSGVRLAALGGGGIEPNPARLLEQLVAMTDEELLGHLNTLACRTAYDWSSYSNERPPQSEYLYLAGLTGAAELLARDFKLTDEWLKRYPRSDLIALAEEAGLGRALVEDCSTQKEMRARILEHAERLHTEGFVPKLVQFPVAKA